MKIRSLETFLVAPRWCFLKITTECGIVGWGEPVVEGKAATVAAAVEEMATSVSAKMPRASRTCGRCCIAADFTAAGRC